MCFYNSDKIAICKRFPLEKIKKQVIYSFFKDNKL